MWGVITHPCLYFNINSARTPLNWHQKFLCEYPYHILAHWSRNKTAAMFADDIFKCIFLNENLRNLIHLSLKFVPKCPIKNNPSLFQIMTWCRAGDKPYLNQWWSTSITHIRVTRPESVKLCFNLSQIQFYRINLDKSHYTCVWSKSKRMPLGIFHMIFST